MDDTTKYPGYVQHWMAVFEKLHGRKPTVERRGTWWELNGVKCRRGQIWEMATRLEWMIQGQKP